MTRTGIGWTTPLSTGTLGNIGKTFSNLRTLSMTCIQNDSGLYGLVIADASSPTINLYFVDLKAEPCPAGRFAA